MRRLALVALTVACTSNDHDPASATEAQDTTGAASSADPETDAGSETMTDSASGTDSTGDAPPDTELPPLPELTNVRVRVVGDAANIEIDPWDAAKDYRVYPLPPDDAIDIRDDGTIVVQDAIYRCAGDREALYMLEDIVNPQEGWNDNAAGGVTILHNEVEGFLRSDADAELGFVYTTDGDDRIPVYVLGDPDPAGEGGPSCGRPVFESGRPKRYTTDAAERDELVAARWRDDGIAFWVPSSASAGTHPVYEGTFGDGNVLRWIDGPEGDTRGEASVLFPVLTEPAADAVPLFRVHVAPYCSRPHDELVAGTARFAKVRSEGDQPLTALRWSGLTEDTVLVVEALDAGCPYQGNLSTEHKDAFTETFGDAVLEYEAYVTLADMRAASATGEVFVNGQTDDATLPRAIARSFVHVEPDLPELDFFATFPTSEDLRATFGEPTGNEYGLHFESPLYHVSSYANSTFHFGTMLGELWFAYNDIAADVNGKVRITPNVRGEVTADAFLHVQTEIDVVSTDRRYPQIIISDREAPVQDNLVEGTTLIVQPKDMTPTNLQVQVCDHRTWDVNDQCPRLPTFAADAAPASALPGETSGTDNAITIDVWLSSTRLYLFLDGEPYSCTDLPATSFEDGAVYSPPSGSVSVTWGDVLYHSGVDFASGGGPVQGNAYLFHRTHMQKTTRRHFDNLGFRSGEPEPQWDQERFPCVAG